MTPRKPVVRGYRVHLIRDDGLEASVAVEAYTAADAVTQAELSSRTSNELRQRCGPPTWRADGVEPLR